MDQDSKLKAYILKAAMEEELPFTEDDLVILEFCARADLVTGAYYDIQYVIFERPSKQSIWQCTTLEDGRCKLQILQVKGDGIIVGHIEA